MSIFQAWQPPPPPAMIKLNLSITPDRSDITIAPDKISIPELTVYYNAPYPASKPQKERERERKVDKYATLAADLERRGPTNDL